jgi:Carboxypeptidase regulatory-like domain/TonB dependent receptor-like, beta-barrel
MTSISSRLTLFSLSLVLLGCHMAQAQDLDTVTIAGRIQDQNAAAIAGAVVQVTLLTTGATRTTTSDHEGRFQLIQLEPGTYVLHASFAGFATYEIPNIASLSAQSLRFDITLYPASINVEPVVVASVDTPIVDTKRTVVGSTLTAHEATSLPIATRSVLDLVFTLPGVTEEPLSTRDLAEDRNTNPANTPEEAGTFALAGSPAYSNNLTIDGLDNNDDRGARERFQPSLEAVEEVQVITNQFSAEYGRASGGRVNLRMRSGSREFRGRVFYFFRDESLNANTFKNNARGLPRLPLQEHDGGFTFSGPARFLTRGTNTLFFVSYESNRVLDSALIDTLVPVKKNELFALPPPTTLSGRRLEEVSPPAIAAEVAPFVSSISTPIKNNTLTARMDQQFGPMHNASIVYHGGRLINLRQFGGGSRLADALQGKRRSSDAISYSDNYVISAQLVNQVRFQFSLLAPTFKAQRSGPVVLIALNDPLVPGDLERRSGTLVAGSSTSGASDRREKRVQLQNVLSLVNGSHSWKFGADIHQVSSTFIDLSDVTGTFNFASAGDFLIDIPTRFRQNFQTESTQKNTYLGFFFQNDWQVLPQLLLSYGLRYERESIVKDQNNFGPRVSVAYSPLTSGKLVIRFGSGVFYNRPLLRTIDDFTLGKQQIFLDTNTLRDPVTGKLLTNEQRRTFIAANFHFPEILSVNSALVKQFGSLNTNFSRRLDHSLRIPESYQINGGVERDLGHGFALEANFTLTRGIHLWREFNANAPVLPSQYKNFSEFLASRDFANFVNPATATRPLHNVSSAGELVRFVFAVANPATANSIERIVESGLPVSVVNLSSPTSTTAIEVALAALNDLRPDPSRAEVEQLISAGNSFYRGLTVELRRRFNFGSATTTSLRAGYTFSRLIDDGIVNTSDAMVPGDFRAERARSLLDRRHRFVFSGTLNLPSFLGALQLSPLFRIASGAPFNISIGGSDRNLDDVGNDRPNFSGDQRLLGWRRPGQSIDPAVVAQFTLPMIGQTGNLPRNAGHGPGLFSFDLNLTREFRVNERVHLRPAVEFDNVLNKTVFSFGSEFINFNALSETASKEQRQAFLDSFLLATRTTRPRQIRVGLRVEF